MHDSGPDDGWESGDYLKLINLESCKIPVTVTGVECPVDGIWEHDYHGIDLPDGHHVAAISDHHLLKLSRARQ